MAPTIDDLTPIEKTLLVTLTARAHDARAERPILGDRLVDKVLDRLGPSAEIVKPAGTVQLASALRSKMLDRLVAEFIAAHPHAVVVELGCGLETRMHRIDPPATVDWYDVDFDRVIQLRREVIPELEHAHLVAGSLTDPNWLTSIPRDRPAIVVADGVVGFLTEAENRTILRAITDHFTAGGELAVVAYARITARLMGSMKILRSVGVSKSYRGWGFDDPRTLEQLNPALTYVEELFGAQAPEVDQLAWPTRVLGRLFARWRAQARRGVWILRYRF
ncbi:class I SAM-dependent methyltransferase [Mycolicibacterium sp. XJ662]